MTLTRGIDELLDAAYYSGTDTIPPAPVVIGAGGIDKPFDWPYFSGTGGGQSLVPDLYQVALDGHGYIIEPSKYQRMTVPLRREATDESVEPGEQSLNTGGAWRRSQDNWFLGAGQEYMDNRFAFVSVYTHSGEDPSVRTRFWRSKGIDPWTEGQLHLLPECNRKAAFTATGSIVVAVGPYLYLWDGTKLSFTASPTDMVPVFTVVTPPAGSGAWPTVHDATTDGTNLYLALGSSGVAMTAAGAGAASYMRPTPAAPAVTPNGATGASTYEYFLVGTDANGFKTFVSLGTTITNGNATLSTPNFNEITWPPIEGIVSWDLLKGDTAHAIGTGILTNSFTDDGTHTLVAYTPPTATTENCAATFVSYGNGFLLGAQGPLLVEINANGTTQLVMKHFNPGFQWQAGCGSPMAIYVAGSAGNRSELYGIQLSTTTFGLDAPYIAGQVTRGELIRDMCYYEGLVILATSLGVRAAQDSQQNGHLDSGPVVTDPGDSRCVVPYGPFVWFGWSNFEIGDGIYPGFGISTGLGRMSLNQFSNPLQPAYTTDVMAQDGTSGVVTSCDVIGGSLYFTVDGDGLWGPNGEVVESGFLETGWVRFGTTEKKNLVSMEARCDPLDGEISIEVVPTGLQSSTVASLTEQGAIGPDVPWTGDGQVGEQFMVIATLKRSFTNPSRSPVLRRWTARALITADRQDQIVVPIIWQDTVDTPMGDGSQIHQDLVAEWQFLKDLESSGRVFTYQEGALAYNCMVDQIEIEGLKWNDQKQMMTGLLSVKLLTVLN